MAAPTPVQADTAGNATILPVKSQTISDIDPVIKHSYSRVYEHYVTNSMDAYGYSEQSADGMIQKFMIDEGWQILPYWNPAIAMRTQDLNHIGAEGCAIRIDSLGYEIITAQIMRQEIVAIAGTTTISNSFASQPYFEMLEDNLHQWDTMVHLRPGTSTTFPDRAMGYDPALLPNSAYKLQEIPTMADGLLRRAVWSYTAAAGEDTWGQDLISSQVPTTGTPSPWEMYCSYNHLGRHIVSVKDMQGKSYTWHNPCEGDWYPMRFPVTATNWGVFEGLQALIPGTFPLSRELVLNGGAMYNSNGGPSVRGANMPNCKHNMWQQVNLETALQSTQMNIPPDHYIKINRLLDQEGGITLNARLLVRYKCDISIIPNDVGFNYSTLSASYGTKGDTTWIAPTYTSGLARRYKSWGIPDLAYTPRSSGKGYSYLYQSATYDAARKRQRESGDATNPEEHSSSDTDIQILAEGSTKKAKTTGSSRTDPRSAIAKQSTQTA